MADNQLVIPVERVQRVIYLIRGQKVMLDYRPDFLRLANALSALYAKDSEEKRLLDAMLFGMPR